MKWLAAILMIANVVIFLGVSDRQIESFASQDDLKPDVNRESMLLLQETLAQQYGSDMVQFDANSEQISAPNVTVSPQAETTGSIVIDAQQGTTSEQTEVASISTLPEQTTVTENLAADDTSGTLQTASIAGQSETEPDWSCYRIGPFKTNELWGKARNWVSEMGLSFEAIRSESRELRAVRVYVGPFATISAAQPAIENLKSRELDHFVYLNNDTEARISLGYFTQEELANKFVEYLSTQQIDAKSQPEYRTLGPYDWMNVRVASGARNSILSRDWGSKDVNILEVTCS